MQKLPYNVAEGDAFERAWLLLATIHLGGGKLDLAAAAAAAALRRNAAAGRAHEVLGAVAERRGDAAAAAAAYRRAWELARGTDPGLGYRLAWNYLKCARYSEAADVALAVLRAFPEYPKIESDVLRPALSRLRAGSEREDRQKLLGAGEAAAAPAPVLAA